MFVNLNIPSFGELLRKYASSFKNRLETSDNIIIHGIYICLRFYSNLVYGFGFGLFVAVIILMYCV